MNNETSESLSKRAAMVRFNLEANKDTRRRTDWFAALPVKRQDAVNRSLERHAAELERQARRAARREAAALIRNARPHRRA
jgi:hypothetical protein